MLDTTRQSVRGLLRAPGLGVASVVCIALGAAATTTVATLVSATLIRPVPFPDGDRFIRVWFEEPAVRPRISLSIPDIGDFSAMRSLDAFVGVARVRTTIAVGSGTERVRGEAVSRGYFDLLGIPASLGRLLIDSDHAADAAPVVVLSHGTWLRHYGGDPAAVGRTLRTAGASYTVVGVTPRGFDGTVEDDIVEMFIPLERYEPRSLATDRMSRPAWVIGRLKAGALLSDAQAEASGIGRELAAAFPEIYRRWSVRVEPFGESWRQALRGGGWILFAAAALLLAIAAINVGCLLVARVLDRRRELALRAALGAEARRLGAQLFVEAFVLVTAGGLLGALAGPWLLEGFLRIAPPGHVNLPRYLRLEPDPTTIALSIGLLALAGLLAGVLPATLAGRVTPADVLRDAGRGTLGRGVERRWGSILITLETALTLVLLVAGGLLIRSYDRLSTLDVGFDRERIARLAVTIGRADASGPSELTALYERLQRELASVPGVERVGLVHPTLPPFDPYRSRVRLGGVDLPHAPEGLEVGTHLVNDGFFPMMGTPLIAGRNIAASDAGGTRVAIISRSLAQLFGGPERALGRTLTFTRGVTIANGDFRVVGVAENVAYDGVSDEETRRFVRSDGDPRAARYDIYAPLAQMPDALVSIGVWTSQDAAAIVEPVRRRIAAIAPQSAVHWTGAMDDEMALEFAPTRFYTILLVAFSSSALALTCIGLFALLSHAATRRTSEMGLRLALGASGRSTAVLLLKDGLAPVFSGVAIGLAGAVMVARAMSALLYGVGMLDGVAFGVSIAALMAVALAAGLLPAGRVASIDPLRALQRE